MLGGIMQTTFQLIDGFRELNRPDIDLRVLSLNVTCQKFSVRRHGCVTVYHLPKSTSGLGFLFSEPFRLLFHFVRVLVSFRPQILHAQGNVSFIMLSLLYGRKSIQTVHGIFRNEQKTIPPRHRSLSMKLRFALRETLESIYLRAVRTIIVTSNQLVDLAKSAGGRPKRIVWIDNSVDNRFFVERTGGDPRPGRVTLLFVGLITPRKGLHFLLPAFERIAGRNANVDLRIVGITHAAQEYVGELKAKFRALIDSGRVTFLGGIEQQALIEEYRVADAFVLPSLGETAPVAISQAMCAGLPVVATNVGGIPDMIDDGRSGLLVPPGNANALYATISAMIEDTRMMREMGQYGRQRGITRYHPTSNAAKTLDLYREVARG
jgi:glycosyltransferase involved in cell wall biosynthesis